MAVNAANVQAIRSIYATFAAWLEKYDVGLDPWVMAAFVYHESGGKMVAGDSTLGEYGLLQTSAWAPPTFGYDAAVRYNAEDGFAVSVLVYGLEAALYCARYPSIVVPGSKDMWLLAKLSTSVGRAGSYALADRAIAGGYVAWSGGLYDAVVKSTAAGGGVSLGSQSAQKVYDRVFAVSTTFDEALAASGKFSLSFGSPQYIPDPPAGPYTVPASAARYFVRPIPGAVLAILGGGAVLLYLLSSRF